MTHRIGSKGQVVIPKELRERAGLHPGVEGGLRHLTGDPEILAQAGLPCAVEDLRPSAS